MNQSEARILVARLAASWPRVEWTEANVDAYVSALDDLDQHELEAAVEATRRRLVFLPSIAEIRMAVAELRLGAPSPLAAFAEAQGRAERHPIVQEARRLVGDDWHWRNTETKPLRRDFDRAYQEILGRERVRIITGRAELSSSPTLELGVSA